VGLLPAYYRVDQTQGLMITHNHINSQRSSTGLQHFNRLGWQRYKKKLCLTFESQLIVMASAAAVASSSKSIGNFQACQVNDHSLEIQ